MITIILFTNAGREKIIVDKNSTIRACLLENDIDIGICCPALNGCTIRPDELDMTFNDLGATEGSVLACIVKTANAVHAKIVGNVVVVESGATLEDLKLIAKYRPKMLTMTEGEGADKAPVFRVVLGTNETGAMSNVGACFSTRTTPEGFATVTISLPPEADATKDTVEEMIGGGLLRLAKMEENYNAVIDDIKAERARMHEHISLG